MDEGVARTTRLTKLPKAQFADGKKSWLCLSTRLTSWQKNLEGLSLEWEEKKRHWCKGNRAEATSSRNKKK